MNFASKASKSLSFLAVCMGGLCLMGAASAQSPAVSSTAPQNAGMPNGSVPAREASRAPILLRFKYVKGETLVYKVNSKLAMNVDYGTGDGPIPLGDTTNMDIVQTVKS